ncbi:MAG: RluA family pseudouridine synthase, partial [Bacteroidaceae bacterium]|nr:RluA family pseudouridine synthase [Bacteroidaceae bacterium]
LMEIFKGNIPPGGTGECCAPKLMQAAYRQGWKPLCMAEFWMGPSPKDELRMEGNYYPACRSKCKPILSFMMEGLDVEPNPLLEKNKAVINQLKIIYEDEAIAVVDKPSGMLSVPGKEELPSVYSVMKERLPQAVGPLIVHRLDMDTSGLMLIAKTEDAYHCLQQQFITHQIEKEYVALLDDSLTENPPTGEGVIDLPLCVNPYDRPRQMVSATYGKRAITHYLIEGRTSEGRIRVRFIPQTGRTHQLRVHAAHPDGLGCPIVGDNLYGKPADRLYLHAEKITFYHPISGEKTTFTVAAF